MKPAAAFLVFLLSSMILRAQNELIDVAGAIALGRATVSYSAIDIGSIGDVFDGSTTTLARSRAVNPMVVTLSFSEPIRISRCRVWFLAGDNRWRIETADSVSDLDAGTGTFRVAFDWALGPESSWQDRTVASSVSCKVVRLLLHRPTGDNYVHLNELQLFAPDRAFSILEFRRQGQGGELMWSSVVGRWYALQSSSDLRQWSDGGFVKAAAETATGVIKPPPGHRFFRVREARPEERSFIKKKVLVLNIDPVIESMGGMRLNQARGWNNSRTLNTAYLADLSEASGGYVQWEVAYWLDLDLWPVKLDGFAYDDASFFQAWSTGRFHDPDAINYEALLDMRHPQLGNRSAHELAAASEVDEIICWAFPYSGFYESRMVGSKAYWCNSPGLNRPSRLYVVMGLNPERGVGEALHSFGHRTESILGRVYGSWSGNATVNHLWDRFTRIGPRHPGATAACGNVHFPPNANADYDYNASLTVSSEADKWLSFPNLTGTTKPVAAASWGGPDYQRNFLRWWFFRLPKVPGRYVDSVNAVNNGKLNNWWNYMVDMNEYVESR